MGLEIIEKIHAALKGQRLPLTDEKVLQLEIGKLLVAAFDEVMVQREFYLDRKSIIDFFIEGVGIEVKIKGQKRSIYKQCERYCEFPEIEVLILVCSVSMGFPKELNNKPCYVIKLTEAWL